MSVVADAGPILSFARANHLDLLRAVVGTLVIPEAVYNDIVAQGTGKPGAHEVHSASWVRRAHVRDRALVECLPAKLHLGECEAIALAKEHGAVLLVDEREARREARQQGIPIIGSLRVLTEARARGLIAQVKPILDELIAAGMYISNTLYQKFLQDIGEL